MSSRLFGRLFSAHRITKARSATIVVASVVACSATGAMADIIGFNNFSGWTYNQADAGSPPNLITPNHAEFTTGTNNRRSIWFNTPQDITTFTVNFTYRASSIAASTNRQGITFAIQNSGLNAVGGVGSGLGYSGIAPSAAITIETDTGPGLTYSGFYTNGNLAGGSASTSPVNAFNGTDIDVTITYSGNILSVAMVQGTNVAPVRNYFVGSLSSTLGSSSAIVGFTGGTFNTLGGPGGARQFISNFSYVVPSPSATALLGLGGLLAVRRRR